MRGDGCSDKDGGVLSMRRASVRIAADGEARALEQLAEGEFEIIHTAKSSPHFAPCLFSNSPISPCPRRFAQAIGVAHGGSSGRFGFAPRLNKNSAIVVWPNFAAHPSGVEQMSSSRACRSAPWSMKIAAFSRSPFLANSC